MEHPTRTDSKQMTVAEEYREYTHIVSHDLSAPVRAMVEFSKILLDEHYAKLDEEAQEYLHIICDSGVKLQAMMRGLLDFSRIENSHHKTQLVDLNLLVSDVVAQIVALPEFAHMKPDVQVSDLPKILASAELLEQLFRHVIDNALRYHRADIVPVIRIDVHDDAAQWRFVVTDNGKGIAADMQERIFQVLGRLHTDEEYPGIGMGLAIAKKIARTYGGTIWCESKPLHGASFTITLAKESVKL